jgi:hypothetical protein
MKAGFSLRLEVFFLVFGMEENSISTPDSRIWDLSPITKVFVNLSPRTFERNSQVGSGNSAKPDGVGAVSQRLIPTGERSGLLTHIAATESVSLCVRRNC